MPIFSHMSEPREAYTRYQVLHSADNRCKHDNAHELKVVVN